MRNRQTYLTKNSKNLTKYSKISESRKRSIFGSDPPRHSKENVKDLDMEFWNNFEEYLIKSYRKSSVRCRLIYAKQYCQVITRENAQPLFGLSNDKRLQVMKSLAILSKYLGCYDRWKRIKERYQLKWSNDDSIQVFQNLTNQESNYSSMLKWLQISCSQIPTHY